MEEHIEFHDRRFDFKKVIDKYKLFQSSDNTINTSIEIHSDEAKPSKKIYKNDCVFLFHKEKEEITKYKFKKGKIDKSSGYKFLLQNGTLKKWGMPCPEDPNLNPYTFNSEKKNVEGISEEYLIYYIEYTSDELKVFVDSIYKILKKPCFRMTTIINYIRNRGIWYIKDNIYKYVLLPNKEYDEFKFPERLEKENIKTIKTETAIINENYTEYYPPELYSLDAKERFQQNIICYKVRQGTTFYGEYLKEKKDNKELTFQEFLLKNKNKKLKKNYHYAEEQAYSTFQQEYGKNNIRYNKDLSLRKISEVEYIEEIENQFISSRSYENLKEWIKDTKIKKPRDYGRTIGTYCEPIMKRYFSIGAEGSYFYKDIVIIFSVDRYGEDFIYEFKTCKQDRINDNLEYAKEQANLYAYLTNKDRIIIEIFSYEEDKIYCYEFPIDKDLAEKRLSVFYYDFKDYMVSLQY